ncbi:hypothetical protein COCVIDRAFT_40755 [Bipolaris victoriae FI3]|uniref:Uncharacterized protein n=1 Tax=Bipolaris victoriae (strain FI3) TaxID=930091 RepID=W7ECJ8_BIPV3|nr:hypothetical protein COCVIDRAFT_40755 [Bipolaris victoriae FI3]
MERTTQKKSKQCLAPLVKTAQYWGMNKVQHYEWASMRLKYCDVLAAAASRNPTGKTNFERKGRRAYTLKYKTITQSDLPVNYVLDRFGVIAAAACQSTPSTFTATELKVPYYPHKVANIFTRSKVLRLLLVQGYFVLIILSLFIYTNTGHQLYPMYISLIEMIT